MKRRLELSDQSWFQSHTVVGTAMNSTYSSVNYDLVPLDHCEALQGQLQGAACYRMLDVFLMSAMLMLGTFTLAMTFKLSRNSLYFPSRVGNRHAPTPASIGH